MNNDSLDKILNIIMSAKSVAVSAHTNPDGDAIGASCALAMAINDISQCKKAKVFLEKYSDTFNVIPSNGIVENCIYDFKPDVYVALDCGDVERLGDFKENFKNAGTNINIDHHKSNTYFGTLNYADSLASSTSEIIYKMINGLFNSFKNPNNIAACIYSGIVFDTGGFRHTSTSPYTLLAASELIKYDFDFSRIYNTIFNTRKFAEAKALGKAIENMKSALNGNVIYSLMTMNDIKNCGADSNGLSEIISYFKGISNCEAAVFVYEKSENVFKVSMRSDNIDVAEIAVKFGGGGHVKAAGCTIEGNGDKIINDVVNSVLNKLI